MKEYCMKHTCRGCKRSNECEEQLLKEEQIWEQAHNNRQHKVQLDQRSKEIRRTKELSRARKDKRTRVTSEI